MDTITAAQIEGIGRRAVNDATREIALHGALLTHEEAADLGHEALAWLQGRLGAVAETTDEGVTLHPAEYAVDRLESLLEEDDRVATYRADDLPEVREVAAEAVDAHMSSPEVRAYLDRHPTAAAGDLIDGWDWSYPAVPGHSDDEVAAAVRAEIDRRLTGAA